MSLENLLVDIRRREESLERDRPGYMRARQEILSGASSDAIHLLFSFKAGDTAEKAVFILAQCQAKLQDYRKLLSTIENFEHRERNLATLKAKLPIEKSIS